MSYKAVIFDFNGTLFWDTPYHNQAWDRFLENHGIVLSDIEKAQKIHGKPNADIFRGIFEKELNDVDIAKMSEEKEQIYRNICLQKQPEFAPGALEFINHLKTNNIDYAIATSSGKENVDFFIKTLHLENFISRENIIFDDGSFHGKPSPDIFLITMKRIGCDPENTIIFEDSMTGIKAAEKANVGKIIIVDSNNDDYEHLPYKQIRNFNEVDRELFCELIS